MKIDSAHVENYRSISSAKVPLSELTVIIGRNNSGKSNFLESLHSYRSYICGGKLPTHEYDSVIHNGQDSGDIQFEVIFELDDAERDDVFESLHRRFDTGVSFILNEIDEYWLTYIKHDFAFNSSGIVCNRISINYQDNWFPISADHQSIPTDNSDLRDPILPRHTDHYGESVYWTVSAGEIGFDDEIEEGVYELNFSHFPDLVEFNQQVGYAGEETVSDIFPEYLNHHILDFLDQWSRTGAFRKPLDEVPITKDTKLSDSGDNLARVLLTISQNRKSSFKKIVSSYVDIMEGVVDIRAPISPAEDPKVTLEIDEESSGESIPLSDISSGSKEILTLITKVVLSSNQTNILTLEEPELHLHPSAEQKVLRLIEKTVEENNIQIISSTHSETFVDKTDLASIIKTDRSPDTEFRKVSDEDLSAELEDLGYSKSELFQSEAVLFVEGRSDKTILEIISEKIGYSFEDNGIEVVVGHGDQLESDMNSVGSVLSQMRIPYTVLLDSDGENSEEKKNMSAEKMGISPAEVLVLEKYSIESYLTDAPSAISRTIGESPEEIREYLDGKNSDNKKGVLDDLFKELVGTGYHEEKHGATIAKNLQKREISDELVEKIKKISSLTD
ncbi:AAA family ATPase [Haloarcula sp. S1AR25-5A]|uniref:AAA family ATPase n=1 Tax=Haloarcula terrestris TaxID=2950533 RepID=A0AAE4JFU1_9EURY|nr:AAA family ATPase [Haloarcula terrestris]MDS0219905.1 AAA family ATPase [Haloarcula terrestris]